MSPSLDLEIKNKALGSKAWIWFLNSYISAEVAWKPCTNTNKCVQTFSLVFKLSKNNVSSSKNTSSTIIGGGLLGV